MRYFLEFCYHGSGFFGFQIQPNQNTIQEELQKALSLLTRQEIKIVGAGRTDTGVHAKKMFAHFDMANDVCQQTKTKSLLDFVHRMNRILPAGIALFDCFEVESEMHARFSATYREYHYEICLEKNPFSEQLAWQIPNRSLDVEKMNLACQRLFAYDDFTSFAKLHTDNKTNICKLYKAHWEQKQNSLRFVVRADRFLRNMVRAMVGTLVAVGMGKISLDDLDKIMKSKNRSNAGESVPAHGLFLVDVGYEFNEKQGESNGK